MRQDHRFAGSPPDARLEARRAARRRRRPRAADVLHSLATLYSVGLVIVAFSVPMIDGRETWVQQFGIRCLLVFGQPLLVSALMWPLLHYATPNGLGAAWLLATLYLLYALLGWYFIAPGAAPAAVLLFIAVHCRTQEVRRLG